MSPRSSLVFILMTCYPFTQSAQEAIFSDAPSIEFLEFLGEWENKEGEWVDPNQFDDNFYARTDTVEEEVIPEDEDDDDE